MRPPEGALRRAREKGSAVLEFALLGTLFVTLLAGAMEFSRLFFATIEVANAARAGAQYGIQSSANSSDITGMQTAATNDAPDVAGLTATASQFCTCSDGTSTACGSGGCSSKRTYVKVVTNATFTTLGTYPLIPNSIPISAKVSIRVK